MIKQNKAMIAAIIGYVICGFSFLFSKMALAVAEPFILLTCRFGVTVFLLNLLLLFRIIKIKIPTKAIFPAIVLGIVQPVLYFIFENYGLKYTTTSFTGMLSAISPIFATVLGVIFLKERPNKTQWLFICISIVGVGIVSSGDSGGENTFLGVICLFGAYLCGAIYNLLARYLAKDLTPITITYVMFTIGFVFSSVISFCLYGKETVSIMTTAFSSDNFVISVCYLGIVSSIVAYSLINYAMGMLTVARATVFCNISTIVSVMSGLIFMHDPFRPINIIAFFLILLGIWGVNYFAEKVQRRNIKDEESNC